MLDGPRWRGPISDHFDGTRFHNLRPFHRVGLGDLLRWLATRRPGPWERVAGAAPVAPPSARITDGDALRLTFISHSTLLLQQAGSNVLTDPVWAERASPFSFAGPKRVRPAGIRLEELPPIDVVVISHNHYDHLDIATLAKLEEAHRPRFVVPLGNRALLHGGAGIAESRIDELDWWDEVDHGAVRIAAVPAQHFANRGTADRDETLWCGFVVRGAGGTTYFAGDTGDGPHFAQIRLRYGPPRLALIPIGGYLPRWFMGPVHIDPPEAVAAHRTLEAHTSVAIHWGTFPLSDEGRDQPLEDLARALTAQGVPPEQFWTMGFGESREIPKAP